MHNVFRSKMDIQAISLKPWEIPDNMSNKDDLMGMLQLVQASLAVGAYSLENEKSTGALTNEEARILMKTIADKINKCP